MPRAKTDAEKFRSFLAGKSADELRVLRDRLEDVMAVVAPKPETKKRTRRGGQPPPDMSRHDTLVRQQNEQSS